MKGRVIHTIDGMPTRILDQIAVTFTPQLNVDMEAMVTNLPAPVAATYRGGKIDIELTSTDTEPSGWTWKAEWSHGITIDTSFNLTDGETLDLSYALLANHESTTGEVFTKRLEDFHQRAEELENLGIKIEQIGEHVSDLQTVVALDRQRVADDVVKTARDVLLTRENVVDAHAAATDAIRHRDDTAAHADAAATYSRAAAASADEARTDAGEVSAVSLAVESARAQAAQSATNAAQSATNATQSATNAAQSAADATSRADTAHTSATAASTYADDAQTSAEIAEQHANDANAALPRVAIGHESFTVGPGSREIVEITFPEGVFSGTGAIFLSISFVGNAIALSGLGWNIATGLSIIGGKVYVRNDEATEVSGGFRWFAIQMP